VLIVPSQLLSERIQARLCFLVQERSILTIQAREYPHNIAMQPPAGTSGNGGIRQMHQLALILAANAIKAFTTSERTSRARK
jgi:hypothetical protein